MVHSFRLCIILVFVGYTAVAQTYNEHFAQQVVATGFFDPVVMAFAPDGRIFVGEQSGDIHIVKGGQLLSEPFAHFDLSHTGERGLLGLAIDPDFENNQYIYLYYTVPQTPAFNRVMRVTANGNTLLEGSDTVLLDLGPLSEATIHNGGALHFGVDGTLFIAVGDNANGSNAINLDSYHGKLLRMNSDGSVPKDNPFTTGSEERKRVWAYGLRNPFTFAIQPTTARIFVNDVGQAKWEEINDATNPGEDFGWPTTAGEDVFPEFTYPIYTYPHTGEISGCAITGGTFFNPVTSNYPAEFYGKYFFMDFCSRWIYTLDTNTGEIDGPPFATDLPVDPLAITTGPDGNLYFLSRSYGILYRIIYDTTTKPQIVNHPQSQTISAHLPFDLSVTALGSPPMTYQWQKNGESIEGAIFSQFGIEISDLTDSGNYRVIVSNSEGKDTSNVAEIIVMPNTPPLAEIIRPLSDTVYIAGTDVAFRGAGSDAEDGQLPEGSFSWTINFHHDTHKHGQPAISGIKHGTFHIPNQGETSDNVWYRLILTVKDSHGAESMDSLDIFPKKSIIRLETIPSGFPLTLDGQPISTPALVSSVQGLLRTIGIPDPVLLDKNPNIQEINFEEWQHGGDAMQSIVTPEKDTTFTAVFSIILGSEELENRQFKLYPNPVQNNKVILEIYSPENQMVLIRINGMLSNETLNIKEFLHQGNNQIMLNVKTLSNGIYFLRVDKGYKNNIEKLLISR